MFKTLPPLAIAIHLISYASCLGQVEYLKEPFFYRTAELADRVSRLQDRLGTGKSKLDYDNEFVFLKSVLEELKIPASSQVLVFSKTSLQISRISPRTPRAIYFNDDTYVGYIPGSDVLEISSVDPKLGAIFFTLPQKKAATVRFRRDRGQCLACHDSARTKRVPGHLVRSVFADRSGLPVFSAGTYTTDHRTPFYKRFGGWYVTGTHGNLRHMGNGFATQGFDPDTFDRDPGANITKLQKRFDTSRYLRPTSDIVALMTLEHQTQMHNYIALAHYETVSAIHYNEVINKALERPAGYRTDSTNRRIKRVADQLFDFMFFKDEFQLTASIKGVSSYQNEFESAGPERSRPLRKLNLNSRMFNTRLSYLVDSDSFRALPIEVRRHISEKLHGILANPIAPYDYLTATERKAIKELAPKLIRLD